MPAETEPKRPPRETWLDVVPEQLRIDDDPTILTGEDIAGQVTTPELLTREEVVDRLLADHSIAVTANNLRAWQDRGILPRAIVRWRDGSKKALYPPWAVPVIARLVHYQRAGLPWQEITDRLRREAVTQAAYHMGRRAHGTAPVSGYLHAYLAEYARAVERLTGKPVAAVEVRPLDPDGAPVGDGFTVTPSDAPRLPS